MVKPRRKARSTCAGDACAANGALHGLARRSIHVLEKVAGRFPAVHLHEGDGTKGEDGKGLLGIHG